MSLKLTDIIEEVAVAAPIIVEAGALAEPSVPAGTEVDLPTIKVRIKGRPIDLDIKATAR